MTLERSISPKKYLQNGGEGKVVERLLYHLDAYVLPYSSLGKYDSNPRPRRAKACYDVMRRCGIKPNSVTYIQVLQAYANDRTEASLKFAESFLKRIVDVDPGWTSSEFRLSALGNIGWCAFGCLEVEAKFADPELENDPQSRAPGGDHRERVSSEGFPQEPVAGRRGDQGGGRSRGVVMVESTSGGMSCTRCVKSDVSGSQSLDGS